MYRVTEVDFKCVCVCLGAQLGPTLCDPMDYSLPVSFLHGIFQARILEWVAISYSRGYSWPKDQTRLLVSWIGRQILYHRVTWKAIFHDLYHLLFSVFQNLRAMIATWSFVLSDLIWKINLCSNNYPHCTKVYRFNVTK